MQLQVKEYQHCMCQGLANEAMLIMPQVMQADAATAKRSVKGAPTVSIRLRQRAEALTSAGACSGGAIRARAGVRTVMTWRVASKCWRNAAMNPLSAGTRPQKPSTKLSR